MKGAGFELSNFKLNYFNFKSQNEGLSKRAESNPFNSRSSTLDLGKAFELPDDREISRSLIYEIEMDAMDIEFQRRFAMLISTRVHIFDEVEAPFAFGQIEKLSSIQKFC